MRARMALYAAGINCDVREVLLKDKPRELLDVSAKATVPVLLLPDGRVIDESLDIMTWAVIESGDPQQWLSPLHAGVDEMAALIALNDNEFKLHLDRYKYPERFEPVSHADNPFRQATVFLSKLESRLEHSKYLFGPSASLADVAIFPFVRQFAAVERQAFDSLPLTQLQRWLSQWLENDAFQAVMVKRKRWQAEDQPGFLF